jgi:hypothetical protein
MLGDSKTVSIFASLLEVKAKRITNWLVRLSVRTPGFHPGRTGSTPVQATKNLKSDSIGDTNLNRFFCVYILYCGILSVKMSRFLNIHGL